MEGRKRKRVSKNKKKSWRKHSDIRDVEAFLEDERLQERTGGLVAEKCDDTLFFVDKKTDEDIVDGDLHRKRRRVKPLRCYSNLEPDPHTAPAHVKHNIRKINNPRKKSIGVLEREAKGQKSKKELKAEDQRRNALRQRKRKIEIAETLPLKGYDLWRDTATEKEIDPFYLKYTRKAKVKPPPQYYKKSSGVSAVEVPHPGASYNPAYDDHQELLSKANEVEIIKEKKEKRIVRALDKQFPSKDKAPTQDTWLEEMSVGLFEGRDDEEDQVPGECDRLSVNPAVRREDKKTRRQRRLQEEKKKQEKSRKLKKAKVQTEQEIFRLKSIKTEIKQYEAELRNKAEKKSQLRELHKDDPKKLGKLKFEESSLELKLSDELEGSLRLLKPEGHLLEDRFKSLQKRNIIEARKRSKFVRKYKLKKFEKKSYREVKV